MSNIEESFDGILSDDYQLQRAIDNFDHFEGNDPDYLNEYEDLDIWFYEDCNGEIQQWRPGDPFPDDYI